MHFSLAFLSAYKPLSKNMIKIIFNQKIESLGYISTIQIISLTFATTTVFFSFIALKKLSSFRVELSGI